MAKPILRRPNWEIAPAVDKPKCPKHKYTMHYSVERGAWACPDPDCKMVAYPDTDTSTGKPILGRGGLQLIIDVGPQGQDTSEDTFRLWLRADNNVMLEITDLVQSFDHKSGEEGTWVELDCRSVVTLP
jgi:hypothetical protein